MVMLPEMMLVILVRMLEKLENTMENRFHLEIDLDNTVKTVIG
jgi:hypothetical protein